MEKTKIIGIIALLLIMVVTAACVQAPAMPEPASGSPVIHYKLYGGFVRPDYSVQELVVTQDRATFTISARGWQHHGEVRKGAHKGTVQRDRERIFRQQLQLVRGPVRGGADPHIRCRFRRHNIHGG